MLYLSVIHSLIDLSIKCVVWIGRHLTEEWNNKTRLVCSRSMAAEALGVDANLNNILKIIHNSSFIQGRPE